MPASNDRGSVLQNHFGGVKFGVVEDLTLAFEVGWVAYTVGVDSHRRFASQEVSTECIQFRLVGKT